MIGEFKAKVREILSYVIGLQPKKENIGEKIRFSGDNADFNITIDENGIGAVNFLYNLVNKDDGGWNFLFFEKGGTPAAFMYLDPYIGFGVDIADTTAAQAGDYFDDHAIRLFNIQKNSAEINTKVSIMAGIPQAELHVKGKVRIDNPISWTATAGTAALPTNPVAFLTINVNGTDYKIPLYGV
ncbi:hypothetical protein [Persephonella sp.]